MSKTTASAKVKPKSAAPRRAKAADAGTGAERDGKRAETVPKNANDHEQQARVHPATPSYCVVVSGAGARGEASTAP